MLIIRFDFATALIRGVFLLALSFGIYVFRGTPSKKDGVLKISSGDVRIVTKGKSSTLSIVSKAVSMKGQMILGSSQASLFETDIVFSKREGCGRASELIKQFY